MKKIYSLLFISVLLSSKLLAQTTLLNESFESITFPPTGWKITNAGTGSNFTRNTTATLSFAGTSSLRCLRSTTAPNDAWIFTPKILLNTNPCNITFWARVRTLTIADTGKLKFTVGTDTSIASQTTVLADSNNITTNTYAKWTITYTPSSAGNYNFAFNCYSDVRTAANQGVFIDSFTITQLQNSCTGTPVAGTLTSTASLVCAANTYTLSVAGSSAGVTGLKYQWQSSPDSINWTDLANDTTLSITKTGLTTTTYYRRKITCSNSSLFAYTNGFKITANSILNCYCGPNTGVNLNSGTTGASIDTVNFVGTKLNNLTTGIAAGGYTLYNDSLVVPTATLTQLQSYNLFIGLTTVTTPLPQNGIASVWIDWNHDGFFATDEYTRVITNAQNGTVSITVPATAVLGATMMRVRSKNNTGAGLLATNPCTSYTNGETEDYIIYVKAAPTCNGTPTGGTTVSTSNSVCANTLFVLNVTGGTSGVGGLTYQWQSSPDNINWSDITGATLAVDSVKTGISSLTYFRRKIICNGSSFSYSSVDTIKLNDPITCYCGPNTGINLNTGTSGATIDTIAIAGINWPGNITSGITPTYKLFNDSLVVPFPKLQQASTYSLTVGLTLVTTPILLPGLVSAWFDWNKNGLLDSSEYIRVITNGQNNTVSFTVPANAPLGKTMMRIRSKNNAGGGLTALNACTSYANGETEDYVINVVAGNTCNGLPNPGTAFSATKTTCPNLPFTLIDTGSTSGVVGLTYQWQSSPDSVNFTNISGATTGNYSGATISTKTYFRRLTICGNYSAASNIFSVSAYTTFFCSYCTPLSGTTLHTATLPSIDSVIVIGSSLANNATGENGTTKYYLDTTKPVPSLYQTLTYNVRVRLNTLGLAGAWIDFNGNNVFDSTEYAPITITTNAGVATFVVPANATIGKTLMRVRSRSVAGTITKMDGCTLLANGETEDYVVNIQAVPACLPPTNLTVPTITATTATVRWYPPANLPPNGYNVYYSTTNNFATATLGATSTMSDSTGQLTGLNSTTLYYVWVVANCGSNLSPSVATSFTTGCGVVTNLPLTEGFEALTTLGNGIMPQCWTVASATGGGKTNFTSIGAAVRNGVGARSGTKFVYVRRNNYNWLISPAVQLTANTQYYFIYNYRPTDPNPGITLNAYVGSAGDTTTLLTTPLGASIVDPIDSSKYTQVVNSFTPTTTGVYYFAIRCIDVALTTANNNLNVDDIQITNTLFSLPPTVSSFAPNRVNTGTVVTIKGKNFTAATAVKFGNLAATTYSVVNDSTINATVGNGQTGTIKVSNIVGTDSIAGFIYCPAATTRNANLSGCNSVVFNSQTYTASTIVRDTLRNVNGCDSVFNVTNITVSPTPVIVSVSSNSPVAIGDTIKLFVDTLKAASTNWAGPNGFVSSVKNPKIANASASNAGWYFVTVQNGSCYKTDSVLVNVSAITNYSISGRVINPKGQLINNAVVKLNNTTVNSSAGNYSFGNNANGNYKITASKNNDSKKNAGITILDVVQIQNHILNKVKLNNAYKLIAADVNASKSITTLDVIAVKKIVLGIDSLYSGSRLWTFADSTYQFPDSTNPFPYKDSISFSGLTNNKINQTFIGVKLGDVNYDWTTASSKGSATKNVELIANTKMENGVINSQFTVNNWQSIIGLQYTLHFDNNKYELVEIRNKKLEIEYNAAQANATGNISILWADKNSEAITLADGSELFTLVLKPRDVRFTMYNVQLSLTNDIAEVEAWDNNYAKHNISLIHKQANNTLPTNNYFVIYPNPSKGNVSIATKGAKEVLVIDYLGRTIKQLLVTEPLSQTNFQLTKGVYVVKAKMQDGSVKNEKLVVE